VSRKVNIELPTPHDGQLAVFEGRDRFNAVRCGRRWGKTQMLIMLASNGSIHREAWGVFAPDYKILAETYKEIQGTLDPIIVSASEMKGVIRLIGGGRIDFWTLNNPRAGRSRKYHGVLIDEAAFAGPDMMAIWEKAIKPSLLDYIGEAWVFSTPNGKDNDQFFYRICTDPKFRFKQFHAPTSANPYMPASEIAQLEEDNDPLVFMQEYLAEFVDWSGVAFFSIDKMLVDGKPVMVNWRPDTVFAVIDSASKADQQHDSTAVMYCVKSDYAGIPLVVLDWDLVKIEASLLTSWVPAIDARLHELANELNARRGSAGIWIEDKDSGVMLNQAIPRHGIRSQPIDAKITAIGKEGRAIAASPYVFQGKVKFSEFAFNKTKLHNQQNKNHALDQVCGFRMGQKPSEYKGQRDLLDCFTYSVLIALGNNEGY